MRPPGDPGVSVKEPSRYGGGYGGTETRSQSRRSLPLPSPALVILSLLKLWALPGGPRQTLISQMHSHLLCEPASSCSSLHRHPEAANCKTPAFSPELGSVRRAQRPPAPQQLLQSGWGQDQVWCPGLSWIVVVTPLRAGRGGAGHVN